jgi:hypothetical protein
MEITRPISDRPGYYVPDPYALGIPHYTPIYLG